ncbi:MAG: nucleoside 2-deoxyribosyltransferase, partial [Caldisericia bacterium]|nr:nucleoside 2-deoxyribosyltransferase [Caldisericia bacterium]
MKVYFAFSIRGGTPDEEIIQTVYKLLKEMGHEVTTEFNINRKSRERYMSDRDIYRRDVEALEKSDV